MDTSYEMVEERTLYDGFFKLIKMRFRHSLYRGGWSDVVTRELYHRSSCVAVLLYDPAKDRVVLIEQFRVGAMKAEGYPWLLEIVAGGIEEGEHPDEVARRESLEEAGCEIRELIRVCEFFTTPGGCSEKITLYCGLVDSDGIGGVHGLPEEHEDIFVKTVSFEEAMELLVTNRVESAIPIIGLQWLALNREWLRRPR
jgi:ADP-ribose pyrophosphatase